MNGTPFGAVMVTGLVMVVFSCAGGAVGVAVVGLRIGAPSSASRLRNCCSWISR